MNSFEDELLRNVAKDIPHKLTRILEVQGYSEKGLGSELGVSQRAISYWKRGERQCTLPQVAIRIHLLAKNL